MELDLIVTGLGRHKVFKYDRFFFNTKALKEKDFPSISQMFFKPYGSGLEFGCDAFHTTSPLLFGLFSALNPANIIIIPMVLTSIALVRFEMSEYSEEDKDFNLDMATSVISYLTQLLVDIVTLPLNLLVMMTRGVSTGINALTDHSSEESPIKSSIGLEF